MPNVISHFALSLLLTFLPAFIAEKILVVTYVFLFAYCFRYLLKSFRESNILLTYLIFPFIFSYPFILGFYNFSFGIVLLFFTVGYWLRNNHKPFSWSFAVGLTALVFLTYTAHLVLLGILLMMLALDIAIAFFHSAKVKRYDLIKSRIISAIIASILPLYFVYQYFADRPISKSIFNSLDISTLLKHLFDLRPIIAFNTVNELPYSRIIVFVFLGLIIISLVNRFRNKTNNQDKPISIPEKSKRLFAGFALLTVIMLYFFLPDSDGRGSYVSLRLGLLIFPFLILVLSLLKFSRPTLIVSISIILLAHFVLVAQYAVVNMQINPSIQEISEVSELIAPNSVVTVLNETDIWFMDHYSSYAGLEKPMVILDNYEADYGYFPVIWNHDSFPHLTIHENETGEIPCLNFRSNLSGKSLPVNYLLIIGNSINFSESCPELYRFISSEDVEALHHSSQYSLYKL
ncbi:hypothetical protein G3O08_17355 [Cryomorpha ignava]|uniref:Glycosyltransferase RgtA/B/C/D-like domain-containing protein n=2 Tax=Cryomorpha ignava TaxID=101383 RepID=A0A7K3WUB7_9FLAO|nr:hypothetical protein [Cryomorpha ignava]